MVYIPDSSDCDKSACRGTSTFGRVDILMAAITVESYCLKRNEIVVIQENNVFLVIAAVTPEYSLRVLQSRLV